MSEWDRVTLIKESIAVLNTYDTKVTLRQLYYRLVAKGLQNCLNSYKRVIAAMTDARWSNEVDFEAFADLGREMACTTKAYPTDLENSIQTAKRQIQNWMSIYHLNRWENQHNYIEVWVEKQALQGVFAPICEEYDVGCFACKGYPSLTSLKDAMDRFHAAQNRGQQTTIIYFGDHDPSGDNIPETIETNISRMGVHVDIDRVALNKEQVIEWGLPPAPVKATDTRSARWEGLGQVELDAVEPKQLESLIREAILRYFDDDLYADLMEREETEKAHYIGQLKEYVETL